MTTLPAELESTASVEEALLDLVDLVERRLGEGTDEVRALRRVLDGRHRAGDESLLASRFSGSRLCVVRCPASFTAAVEREVAGTPGALLVDRAGELVVLVPGLPRQASSKPGDRLARLVARLHRAAPQAAIGVSTVLDSTSQGRRGLDEAVRAASACAPGQAVYAEQDWFAIAVSRLRESVSDSLAVDNPLDRLGDGLRSGVDLRETLRVWLEADRDVRSAADRLHLHPNTLRYRVRRAGELTGIDFDDPLQRLVAHLALTSGA